MARREEWVKGKHWNFENQISSLVDSVVRPVLPKFSKIEADLILNWNKIFDKTLAEKITFNKISFTDKKNNKFILHVNVKPQDYLEITHSTQIIQEQLNIFLGYAGTEKVRAYKSQ